MNKQELTALVAEILGTMEPQVKGSDYKPTNPGPQPVEKMSRPAHVYYYITGSSLFPMVEEEINGIFAGCIFGVEKIRSPLLYRNMFLIRQEQIRDFSWISPMVAARRKISLSGNPKHGFLFENWIICS